MDDLSEQAELTECFEHPETYKLDLEYSSFDEILHLFCIEILHGCSFTEVESAFVTYVTSIIEPVGWKAIWRTRSFGAKHDFIVDVINVSLQKLEADVYVKSVIVKNIHESVLNDLRKEIDTKTTLTVPLIELIIICEDDEEELFAKTAEAIEYTRFFMTHLTRPWDGEIDDLVYTEKLLKPRLQLYFDMKNNILPKSMIIKIKSILKHGWSIVKKLNLLFSYMNLSDSEAEVSEDDIVNSMALKAKLTELQAKMEILENPVIRTFMMKKFVPNKPQKREISNPVVFIVSKYFTFDMINNLHLDSSSILEFEHNPEVAFKRSCSGDKIFIFPGFYKCDSLGWIEGEIIVEGIGSTDEIVLEATGNSEVLLNCCAGDICLQNISLKAKSGLLSAIVVHHGQIHVNNCIVDSNGANIGILILGGSSAIVENTTICSSSEDGIQMRPLTALHLTSSQIISCKRNGIQIDAEDVNSTANHTELSIKTSHISENNGHGIFLNNIPISEISLKKPSGDSSILHYFPWLKSNIEDSEIYNNGQSGVGVSSVCKNQSNDYDDTSKVFPSCPNPDEWNSSALSDFLNEISFTDITQYSTASD